MTKYYPKKSWTQNKDWIRWQKGVVHILNKTRDSVINFCFNTNTVNELHEKYNHQKSNKVLSKYSKCSRSVSENEFYNEMDRKDKIITTTWNYY